MNNLRTGLTKLALVSGVVCATSAFAQFVPPGQTPPEAPQSPGATPGQEEFPGPGGKTFRFPTGLYDEKADATKTISEARELAKKEHKRVLVMWGENRCGFCVFLNDLLKNDPQIRPLVKGDYVWVKVDIGKFDKNIGLADYYRTPMLEQGFGAPALTIIDPVTDQTVDKRGGNSMVAKPMTITRPFDEKIIFEFLNDNKPPAQVAQSVMNNALADAKKAGNDRILSLFVVPGSDECDAIMSWAKRAEKTALSKSVSLAKIDTQRMIGGTTVLKRAAGSTAVAAPFLVLLDAEGNSVGPETMFTALPKTDGEFKQFDDMLKKHAPKLSDAERAAVIESLKEPAGAASSGEHTPADKTQEAKK